MSWKKSFLYWVLIWLFVTTRYKAPELFCWKQLLEFLNVAAFTLVITLRDREIRKARLS